MKDLAWDLFVLFCSLETKSLCVAQVGLELLNLLSASGVLVCWASYHTQLKSWYLLNVHSIYSRHRRTQQTVASTPGGVTSTGTRTRVHPSTHTQLKQKSARRHLTQQVALSLPKTCWMAPALFPKRMLAALNLQKRPRGTS